MTEVEESNWQLPFFNHSLQRSINNFAPPKRPLSTNADDETLHESKAGFCP